MLANTRYPYVAESSNGDYFMAETAKDLYYAINRYRRRFFRRDEVVPAVELFDKAGDVLCHFSNGYMTTVEMANLSVRAYHILSKRFGQLHMPNMWYEITMGDIQKLARRGDLCGIKYAGTKTLAEIFSAIRKWCNWTQVDQRAMVGTMKQTPNGLYWMQKNWDWL